MLFSKWTLRKPNPQESSLLQQERGIPAILADILAARELSPYQISELFDGDFELEDPMLLPDMAQAVRRIEKGIDMGEQIAVYGDYDCDGVTATVMLYSYLQSIGGRVCYYIPARLGEGYGMNQDAVDRLHAQGVTLIITVDNGISAINEIAYASSLGIDTIVTDHHQVGEQLPQAVAVVDPHRKDYAGEFRHLCGAGVAFKLITAMEGGDYEQTLESFGALTAIGTIGDVMPLVSENRFFVKKGLELLKDTELVGLQALMNVSGLTGKPLTAHKIAFGLSPRINAAGRMDSADQAAKLLLSEDDEEANALAETIDQLNTQRKDEETQILEKIQVVLQEHPEWLRDRVLVIAAEGLSHGVIGIVSAKLVTIYGKPNIILSVDGEEATGSARSIDPFSLFQAISSCAGLLDKFGGHTMAAGLSLKAANIPAFREQINRYAAKFYDQMPVPQQRIDRILHIGDINLASASALTMLEPFGEQNAQPVFLLKDCRIEEIFPLAGGKHLKLRVLFEGQPIHLLYFRMTPDQFIYPVGSSVEVLVTMEVETFRNNRSIALKVQELRPAGFSDRKFHNAAHYYEKIRRGEFVEHQILRIAVPTLDELRKVYKAVLWRKTVSLPVELFYLMAFAQQMNYCTFRLCLDILEELGLLHLASDFSSITLCEVSGKVNLDESAILSSLRKELGSV